MVFSSIPAYLDPANWQQQPNHPTGSSSGTSSQLPPPTPPPPPHPPQPQPSLQPHGAGSSGSIRPGSMVDRARLASIPMPEAALKCPRCESTNTKFCYFNNYNLSQPRHFCKTCRRYWTRGGALRNVPVGGGCRRNKRSKASSSKSPVSSDRQTGRTASSGNSISSNSGSTAEILGLTSSQLAPLRFMNPLSHQLTDFAAGDMGLSYGLSYSPVSAPMGGISDLNFQIGNAFSGNGSSVGGITSSFLSASGLENWKLQQTQQYPLMAGLETSSGLYSFEGGPEGYAGVVSHVRPKPTSTAGLISQMASVKMEESHQEMNLSRQLLGMNNQGTDHQYWTGSTNATWTDLSANFSSSSNTTSNPL